MKLYHILGHSNALTSIILDTLYLLHKHEVAVVRVNNLTAEEIQSSHQAFHLDAIRITDVFHQQWDHSIAENFLMGTFNVNPKKQIYQFFADYYSIVNKNYTILVHPHSSIARTVQISSGVQIGPGVAIAPYTKLENFVTVNRNVSIGHHTIIGNFSTVNPGCNIAGNCVIGSGVTIGMGANIVDGIEIGDNVIVGAGALVTKSVKENTTVYGVPARTVKTESMV